MKLEELVYRDMRAGHWRSTTVNARREVYHYSTLMLSFPTDEAGLPIATAENVWYETGHGSVSDQQGMNRLFRELGLPLYYSRRGGSAIKELIA